MKRELTELQQRILRALKRRPHGLTDKQIHRVLRRYDVSTIVSARNGLTHKGLIKNSGKKRMNLLTMREAIVWLAR